MKNSPMTLKQIINSGETKIERMLMLWEHGYYSDNEFVNKSILEMGKMGSVWANSQIFYRDYEKKNN